MKGDIGTPTFDEASVDVFKMLQGHLSKSLECIAAALGGHRVRHFGVARARQATELDLA